MIRDTKPIHASIHNCKLMHVEHVKVTVQRELFHKAHLPVEGNGSIELARATLFCKLSRREVAEDTDILRLT